MTNMDVKAARKSGGVTEESKYSKMIRLLSILGFRSLEEYEEKKKKGEHKDWIERLLRNKDLNGRLISLCSEVDSAKIVLKSLSGPIKDEANDILNLFQSIAKGLLLSNFYGLFGVVSPEIRNKEVMQNIVFTAKLKNELPQINRDLLRIFQLIWGYSEPGDKQLTVAREILKEYKGVLEQCDSELASQVADRMTSWKIA